MKPSRRALTHQTHNMVATHCIEPHVGRVPLAKLTPEHVQAMKAKLVGVKPRLSA